DHDPGKTADHHQLGGALPVHRHRCRRGARRCGDRQGGCGLDRPARTGCGTRADHGRNALARAAGHGRACRRAHAQDAGRPGQRLLWRQAGAQGCIDRGARRSRDRLHRTVRLRQVDFPALPQPDERHHRRGAGRGPDRARRPRHQRARHGRGAAPRPRGHGVPEAQPLSQIDLRERRLRPAHPRARPGQERAGRHRREVAAARRPVGRGQGSTAGKRHRPIRRSAAALVHRPGDRSRSGGDPDGRAVLGARPNRHRQDRGADPRTARALRHRHRHPQYAAGCARLSTHRLFPPRRADRIQPHQRYLHQPARAAHPRLHHRPLRL
ncbi:MAG: Phosphate transport ATP-binding protein PstB, partial [uncultured Sphingomonas sp.]